MNDNWVKLGSDAANNKLVWEVVTLITGVLEDMGIATEEEWDDNLDSCTLVFTHKEGQE